MNLLSVENLSKKYPAFELKDVSFDVKQGSIMGFIGKNGAGKSTTLKAMLNMVHPDSGTIEMLGKILTRTKHGVSRISVSCWEELITIPKRN